MPRQAATPKHEAGDGAREEPTTLAVSAPSDAKGNVDPRPHATWSADAVTNVPAATVRSKPVGAAVMSRSEQK